MSDSPCHCRSSDKPLGWSVCRIIGIVATLGSNILAARLLGPAEFGTYLLITTVIALGSLLAMAGLNEAARDGSLPKVWPCGDSLWPLTMSGGPWRSWPRLPPLVRWAWLVDWRFLAASRGTLFARHRGGGRTGCVAAGLAAAWRGARSGIRRFAPRQLVFRRTGRRTDQQTCCFSSPWPPRA